MGIIREAGVWIICLLFIGVVCSIPMFLVVIAGAFGPTVHDLNEDQCRYPSVYTYECHRR